MARLAQDQKYTCLVVLRIVSAVEKNCGAESMNSFQR